MNLVAVRNTVSLISIVFAKTLLLIASLYLIWGWITVGDIRSQCEKKGIDADQAIARLAGPSPDIRIVG